VAALLPLSLLLIAPACQGDAPPEPDAFLDIDAAADAAAPDAALDAGRAALLDLDARAHDFGDTLVGGIAVSAPVMVTNTGGATSGPLAVVLVGADAAHFDVVGDACSGKALASGASCVVVVTFAPAAAGDRAASLTVDASPGGTVSAALIGRGLLPGALTITPGAHDFGAVALGAPPSGQTFTVENSGDAPTGVLDVTLGGADAGDFVHGADTCSGAALPPGQSCTVSIGFAPASAGARSATLSVSGTPGGAAVAMLSGVGQTPATLQVAPSTIDFGPITAGNLSPPVDLVVQNLGQAPSGALVVSVSGQVGAFSLANGCAGASLAGGASCTITVRFAPGAAGPASATVGVSATPGGGGAAQLTGLGLSPAALALAPASQSLGAVVVGQTSGMFTLTASNGGQSQSGTLLVTLTGPDAADFGLAADGCSGGVLGGGDGCAIIVVLSPASPGPKSATLTVTGMPGGAASATLSGSGLAPPALAIAPGGRDYGAVTQGQASASQAFTVTNVGGAPAGTPVPSLAGLGADQFQITSHTCVAPLAAGASCSVDVRFAPTSPGAKSATLQASAAPGGTATASLAGTGLSPAALALAPASHGFGTTTVGQPTGTTAFTVTNTGQSATGALSVGLGGGAGAAHFDVVTSGCVGPLAGGASCTVHVRFDPLSAGSHLASLDVAATPGGAVSASISGVGLTPAALAIAPGSHDYGDVVFGAEVTKAFTVTNTGQSPSGALGVGLGGDAAYTVIADSCTGATLPALASCSVTVRFAAAAPAGGKAGTLTASAAPGGTVNASLAGAALAPASLSIAPATHDFGSVVTGDTSVAQDFVVTNDGDQASSAPAAALTGAGAADFEIVADGCAAPLAGGASCTVSVRFAPATRGARSATLEVAAATGGTAAATLTGDAKQAATLAFTPAAHAFGDVALASTSAPVVYTLANSGDVSSSPLTLVLAGDVTEFLITDGCSGAPLAAGATCTIEVGFAPLAPGPHHLDLSVAGAAATADGTGTAP
jgi:hypothetical protein